MLSNENSLRAPSIRLRHWAKRLRVGLFIICILVIGYFSWRTLRSTSDEFVFWIWMAVNAFAWGWETWYLLRRPAALLVTSEAAVQIHYKTWVSILAFAVTANALLMTSLGIIAARQAEIVILMVILYSLFTLAALEYDALRWF